MSKIRISDLEVFYRVGVPEEERAVPQRLLLSFDLELDFDAAAPSDDISKTINDSPLCKTRCISVRRVRGS